MNWSRPVCPSTSWNTTRSGRSASWLFPTSSSTRSVALTSVGGSFLPQARRLLADLTAALVELRETGQAQRGNVTIACVPTAGIQYLPRILQEYSVRHPENRVVILDHASRGVAE